MLSRGSFFFLILWCLCGVLFASENSSNLCNKALIRELQKFRREVYSTPDRAVHLILKARLEAKILEVSRKLKIDPRELINLIDLDAKQYSKSHPTALTVNLQEALKTRIQNRIKHYLKDDPHLDRVLKWVNLAIEDPKAVPVNDLYLVGRDEKNIYMIKAALLLSEDWKSFGDIIFEHDISLETLDGFMEFFFEKIVLSYDDPYLAKLWVVLGGNPENTKPVTIGLPTTSFASPEKEDLPYLHWVIFNKAWNTAKAFVELGVDPLIESEPKIISSHGSGRSGVVYQINNSTGVLYLKQTYENLDFLKYLIDRGADVFSTRSFQNIKEVTPPLTYTMGRPNVLPLETLKFLFPLAIKHKPLNFHQRDNQAAEIIEAIHSDSLEYGSIQDYEFAIQNGYQQRPDYDINSDFFQAIKQKNGPVAQHIFNKGGRLFGKSTDYLTTFASKIVLNRILN